MSTFLVTGGNGFIGSHFVDKILANGDKVIVVDKNIAKIKYQKSDSVILKNIDINDSEMESVFADYDIDYCIHLAAQVSVSVSIKDPILDATNNILGSINIFRFCKAYGVKKVLIASSAAVYGTASDMPLKENIEFSPISFYGLSKYTMEHYLKLFEIDYLIARFSNVFGERQDAHGEAGVVAIFNDSMKAGRDIYIDGDGEQTRDFIYVKDLVKICVNAMDSDIKNIVFNVCTNTSVSVLELFKELALNYNYTKPAIFRESRLGDIKHSVLDNSIVAKNNLITKYTSFAQGIKNLCAFELGN